MELWLAPPAQPTTDSPAVVVLGHTANFLESIGDVPCVRLYSMCISRKVGETEKVFSWSRFLSDVVIDCDSGLQLGRYMFWVAK